MLTCGWCLVGECVGNKEKGKGQKRNEGKHLCKDVEMKKKKKPRRAGESGAKDSLRKTLGQDSLG